jgi:hypothetical protein
MRFYGYRLFALALGLSAIALCLYAYDSDLQVLRGEKLQPAGWSVKASILAFAVIGLLMAIIPLVSMVRRILHLTPAHSR